MAVNRPILSYARAGLGSNDKTRIYVLHVNCGLRTQVDARCLILPVEFYKRRAYSILLDTISEFLRQMRENTALELIIEQRDMRRVSIRTSLFLSAVFVRDSYSYSLRARNQ